MTSYQKTIDFLFNALPMYQRVGKVAYKANLDNSHKLDEHLNYPHKNFTTIHIAGTNGKGSVSHSLASILQQSGYKTGLYTSPHLIDFRERIRVNGELITKKAVVDFVEKNKDYFLEIKPSFFEMTVFMAFHYFAICKVDVGIIEVGLGGRLDSTNVISPALSIITNIGFDHTLILGDSLPKIAVEKGGIIKKNVPVIIGQTQEETMSVFNAISAKTNSKIYYADKSYRIDYSLKNLDNSIRHKIAVPNLLEIDFIDTDLLGMYQQKNICTCLKAIEILNENGFNIPNKAISAGYKEVIKTTGLIGRWHIQKQNPLVICDTAHNKEGLHEVVKQLQNTAYKKLHLVLGFINEKNIPELLKLFPSNADYYFSPLSIERTCKTEDLLEAGTELGLNFFIFDTIFSAYQKALELADVQDLIFIGGSTFSVADYFIKKNN